MQPVNWSENENYCHFLSGKGFPENNKNYGDGMFPGNYDFSGSEILRSSQIFPWEISEITETPEARALAASKSHREAEKRRRERINSHLEKLRSILPCNSKIDKATLLAKVVQRLRELKEQTQDLIQLETFPLETDEISINNIINYDDNKVLIKVSFCCEDRSDLIPELIETLRSLRLSIIRAEIATLGGRIRNIMIISGEKDQCDGMAIDLRDALKSLTHRSSGVAFRDGFKRRRAMNGSLANTQ